MPWNTLDARLSRVPQSAPQCEALFEIVDGKLGSLQLGRLLKGNDAGRLVVLRSLAGKPRAELASATDLARSIAHPRLAKVLGVVRDADTWYIASEYISGVTLLELGQTVLEHGSPLDAAVSVRIVLDALRAAAEAQRLLAETANLHDVRCIYPESIWIADFGEVFLSELLIAPLLAESVPDLSLAAQSNLASSAAANDARAAADELLRLLGIATALSAEPAFDPDIPEGLRPILVRAASTAPSESYADLQQLIGALAELGAGLHATEQQVSAELQRVMGFVLERRQQKLDMLERFSPAPGEDDATRFFRVALAPEQSDTTRPPPAPPSNAQPSGIPKASARPERQDSQPAPGTEERTAIFGSLVPAADPKQTPMLPVPRLSGSPGPSPIPIHTTNEAAESAPNPISAVWRQARALLDSPARSAKQRLLQAPTEIRPSLPAALRAGPPSRVDSPIASPRGARRLIVASKAVFAIALLLALAALLHSLWAGRISPTITAPKTASSGS